MTKTAVKERDAAPDLLKDVTPQAKIKVGDKVTGAIEGKIVGVGGAKTKTQKSTAVAKIDPREAARVAAHDPTGMVSLCRELALNPDVPVDKWQAVLNMQMQILDRTAKAEFDNAMAEAKSEIPVIFKNRQVDFTSQKGRTHYRHEDMAGIARTIDPILSAHGLSYRYRTTNEAAMVTVTCIVSHRLGHSEETSLSAARDETGNKNSIQAVGSTVTYLQRYTLKAALGLAASDDDDGKNGGKKIEDEADTKPACLDIEQSAKLVSLIKDSGVGIERFLDKYKIKGVIDLDPALYDEATKACKDYAAKNKKVQQ